MTEYEYLDIKRPLVVRTEVKLPASKSISNRLLIINALVQSPIEPKNLSECDDTRVMRQALRNMPEVIDIGAAGTAMRFLTAYLCVTPGTHTLTGTPRMKQRPIGVLVDALRSLGAEIEYLEKEGFPPLRITGCTDLAGGELTVRGDISSQYISALLMIAPRLKSGLTLHLTGEIASRPYLKMTIEMMRQFGAEVDWDGEGPINPNQPSHTVRVGTKVYEARPYTVEPDWSAASYWYEIIALTNDPGAWAELPGLRLDSLQGDKVVQDIFERLGVRTEECVCECGEKGIRLRKNHEVTCYLPCDFTSCPDLAQTTVLTCIMLGVPFSFTGLKSLRIKETDRIQALKSELERMGYVVQDSTDGELEWDGERFDEDFPRPTDIRINTYEDHRMAMAFAPVCCQLSVVKIMNPNVVSKSYPHFWRDLRRCGFRYINLTEEEMLKIAREE